MKDEKNGELTESELESMQHNHKQKDQEPKIKDKIEKEKGQLDSTKKKESHSTKRVS